MIDGASPIQAIERTHLVLFDLSVFFQNVEYQLFTKSSLILQIE